jgi:hypothetical protein
MFERHESRRFVLLTESAHIRGLAHDDVLHGIEELGACGVDGQVEHLPQRIEFEYVVMVPWTGGRLVAPGPGAGFRAAMASGTNPHSTAIVKVVDFVTVAPSATYH